MAKEGYSSEHWTAAFFIGVASFVLGFFLRAWALKLGWDWFLVPVGLPAIGKWHVFGIASLGAVMLHTTNANDSKSNDGKSPLEMAITGLVLSAIKSPLYVLVMWFLHEMMAA